MFKYYTTYDIISETEIEIIKAQYSIQILLDLNDFYFLADALISKVNNSNINVEMVIVSNNNSKPLKFINLCKRLVDLGVSIYWINNIGIYNEQLFIGVFDKTYVLEKEDKNILEENIEVLVRNKNSFFKSIVLKATKLELLSGDINIVFTADKTFVNKNTKVLFTWKLENSHFATLEPDIGKIPQEGSCEVDVVKDINYTLTATNKEFTLKKNIFLKVIDEKEIIFDVRVLDPVLDTFVKIEESSSKEGNYGVYSRQLIKISWEFNFNSKFHEASLGNLPLVGIYEFEIQKEKELFFTLNTIEDSKLKKIKFHPFENEKFISKSLVEKSIEKPMLETKSTIFKLLNNAFKRNK